MSAAAGEADRAAAVAGRFALAGAVPQVEPFGGGHVNSTWRVTDDAGGVYVLQRVNRRAFKQPLQVMENIVAVTAHLAAKSPDPRRRLSLVAARDGRRWVEDEAGEVWRLYDFVAGSTELPLPVTPAGLGQAGAAFGQFLLDLADLPAGRLHTTIADYHNWPRYVARLKAAAAADRLGRVGAVGPELALALSYEAKAHAFDDPALMPLRVTHNDAKVANVLFDAVTLAPLAVVDLDTVQPGLAVNDFGDLVRSGAVTAGEEEPDAGLVHFSPERFTALAEGYLAVAGAALTRPETDRLHYAARLMTLETSLRFLTDHLEGDVYYRIDRPGQNLDRARNQLALLVDLDRHFDWMADVVRQLTG